MARLNADGSRDLTYTGITATGLFGGSQQVLLQPDDRAIVSAQIPTATGAGFLLVRLTREGALDPTFSVQGSARWTAALLSDRGEVIAGDDAGYLHRFRAQSPPAIAAQPQSQSAVFGTTVRLTVGVTIAGNYTFRWAKDGNAIAGATGATLTLNNAVTATGGTYTVTITGVSGTVVSAPAVVTVAPRPLAGAYFGQLGGASGQFAIFLRADGTGVLLGFVRDRRIVLFVRDVTVDATRSLRVDARVISSAGTQDDQDILAQISPDGTVTGSIPGLGLSMAGTFDAAIATNAAIAAQAGYYRGGAANSQAAAHAIIGASGTCHLVVFGGGMSDSCSTTVGAGLALSRTSESGAPFTGSLAPETSLLSAAFAPAGAATVSLLLGNPALRGDPERLANISTRARVGGAAGTLTAGFFVAGSQSKTLLARGVGPSLANFGVASALPAARIEVFRGSSQIATGGAWGQAVDVSAIAATASRVGAFALSPSSRDAALLLLVLPGGYSTSVTGADGATGVALLEIYDAEENPTRSAPRISNLSTLSTAGVGDDTLTVGFVVTGAVPKRLLIRAAGPSLAQFGVGGVLARPRLSLYSGVTILLQNTGWTTSRDARAVAQAATEVGAFAFPTTSLDSADFVHLPAGAYSVQVTSSEGVSGTALVEIYELP